MVDEPVVDEPVVTEPAVSAQTEQFAAQTPALASAPTEVLVAPKPAPARPTAPDRRPIIDLTSSPTDEQLQEFLRRRAEADAEYLRRQNAPGPRRRGRAPQAAKVADVHA